MTLATRQASEAGRAVSGDATTRAIHHPAIECSTTREVVGVVSSRTRALVALATIGTLPTILAIVLAVLIAMAVRTSQLWDDWGYVISCFAAPVEVHRRSTKILPALRRAGDQRFASEQRAVDTPTLASIGLHVIAEVLATKILVDDMICGHKKIELKF